METTSKYDWDFIMTDNDYNIAQKLLEVYENKDFAELGKALKYYLSNSISSAKLEVHFELRNLMEQVFMWKYSEAHRTQENWERICRHRDEIEELIEDYDCLTIEVIKEEWDDACASAKSLAFIETRKERMELDYEEVIEKFLPHE